MWNWRSQKAVRINDKSKMTRFLFMNKNEKWLEWAIELQSLAQAGLIYGKDAYDRE